MDIDKATQDKINPQQAELNAILTTGKYIIIDSKGSSLIMGIENPEYILNLLSAVSNKVLVTMADNTAYGYCARLCELVEKACKVKIEEAPETTTTPAEASATKTTEPAPETK